MDAPNALLQILNLVPQPAFAVQGRTVICANNAAKQSILLSGAPLTEMLGSSMEDYEQFSGGYMYLTLHLGELQLPTQVNRIDGTDIFTLTQSQEHPELQALALAAQKLRIVLSGMVSAADQLLPSLPEPNPHAAQLRQGIYQLLRSVGNMADAGKYADSLVPAVTVDVDSLIREILEKAGTLLESRQIKLVYHGLSRSVYCLVQQELLERAIYNLLSNAVKNTAPGGTVEASLSRNGSRLSFTLQDSGCGVQDLSSVFANWLRAPGVEDGRKGIGLGMVLVREAAAAHGGTVLLEQPQGKGLKVTLTMEIRQGTSQVRSPLFGVDYAGELDHGLIELADVLPWESFQ